MFGPRALALAAWLGLGLLCGGLARGATPDPATLAIVVGAPGEAEYGTNFQGWADLWRRAGEQSGARTEVIGLSPTRTNDLQALQELLAREPKTGRGEFWLVLIGHGTFDGTDAKFNLRGPDLVAPDLARGLQPFRRPVVVINSASSSAPFLRALSASNRVVVTATRSGFEQNYARFGQYLAEAIVSPEADLDHDGQTSLLEAFLLASRQVAGFYRVEGRLATEHALLDDNGDGLGTPADWFRGIRAIKKAQDNAALDGVWAHQIHLRRNPEEQGWPAADVARRDALEQDLARLRERKGQLPEDEYYRQLEAVLVQLARLYVR